MIQIHVLVPEIHPRIQYVIDWIQSSLQNAQVILHDEVSNFLNTEGIRINYSNCEELPAKVHIHWNFSSVLLLPLDDFPKPDIENNDGIIQLKWNKVFDLPSAIFYCLARVEEYQKFTKDAHGRFPFSESILQNYIETPILDQYIEKLIQQINSTVDSEVRLNSAYDFSLGIDIDYSWKYLFKPSWKQFGGFVKDFLFLKIHSWTQRMMTLLGSIKDPYDQYDTIIQLVPSSKLQFFFLSGGKTKQDNNHSLKLQETQALIQKLNRAATVQLHPSYSASDNFKVLKEEFLALSSVLNKKIDSSRFHFLKLSFPNSYRNLINLGILSDYSMVYAEHVGFRSGTCRPFYWYDAMLDQPSSLKIVCPVLMDRTLKDYMKLNPEEARSKIKSILSTIKHYQGHAHIIWHNSSLNNDGEWEGWTDVFYFILQELSKKEINK